MADANAPAPGVDLQQAEEHQEEEESEDDDDESDDPDSRVPLQYEVRALVQECFNEDDSAVLCELLERYGFSTLTSVAEMHQSLGLRREAGTAAHKKMNYNVLLCLCPGKRGDPNFAVWQQLLAKAFARVRSQMTQVTAGAALLRALQWKRKTMRRHSAGADPDPYDRLLRVYFFDGLSDPDRAEWIRDAWTHVDERGAVFVRCCFLDCARLFRVTMLCNAFLDHLDLHINAGRPAEKALPSYKRSLLSIVTPVRRPQTLRGFLHREFAPASDTS